MNWFSFLVKLWRDKLFRDAVTSVLWPKIIQPMYRALVKKVLTEAYGIVLRSVQMAEKMANDGEIEKEEKWHTATALIITEAEARGVEISRWARDTLIQFAVAEMDNKWEEFK